MRIQTAARWAALLLLVVLTLPGCTCSSPAGHEIGSEPMVDPDRFAASVITISWNGLTYVGRGPAPTRTQAEALVLAEELAQLARDDPDGFADLARDRSEGPNSWLGGRLGTFPTDDLPPDMASLAALPIGGISAPIETANGYMVFKREAPVPEGVLSGRRLVVSFDGAERAPPGVIRDRSEAKLRSLLLLERAKASPSGFEALIVAESDGFDRDRGGYLGTWTAGSGRMPTDVEAAIAALEVGDFSIPLRSEFGYTIYQRLPAAHVAHLLAGSHILLSHSGARSSKSDRSRDEAKALAEEVAAQVRDQPVRFAELAAQHSDDGTAQEGGYLGAWKPGTKLPRGLDVAFAAMTPKEVAGPVETVYGFHVIRRDPSPDDRALDYMNPTSGGDEAPAEPHGPGDGHDHGPGDGHDHGPGDGHDHGPGEASDPGPEDGKVLPQGAEAEH